MLQKIPKGAEKFLNWVDANNLKTSEGKPFEWSNHWFLVDPLTDWHPTQGWNKAAQMGASESVILKAAFMVQELHLNTIYALPSDDFVKKFVPTKFDPIINKNSSVFTDWEGGMYVKHVGQDNDPDQAFLLFMGAHLSQSESNAAASAKGVAVTAHALIFDERSKMHPFVVDQMYSRTLNSPWKYNWSFDNPTYPNVGSDIVYQESDQRHYIIRCSRCGYRQYLDWFKLSKSAFTKGTDHCFIDDVKKCFICGKCAQPLRDEDRMFGEWVAFRPSVKDKRGYWFNQMMYVNHTAEYLLGEEKDRTVSYFHNMILGKPYVGSDVSVTRQTIARNVLERPFAPVRGKVGMGVDQGAEKQWVLGDKYGIFAYGRTKDWDEIRRIREEWDAFVVMDSEPEDTPIKICEENPGRAWRGNFSTESYQTEVARFGTNSDKSMVLIKREELFDQIAHEFNNGEFPINININKLDEYVKEWGFLVRTTVEDTWGNKRPKWVKTHAKVDFPFATLYWKVAMMKADIGDTKMLSAKTRGSSTSTYAEPTAEKIIIELTKDKK